MRDNLDRVLFWCQVAIWFCAAAIVMCCIVDILRILGGSK